jgi:hypothetical protein
MALYHFSNVVTRDLLFYYDAVNPKSWRGAPATNILENNLSAFNDIVGNSTKTVIGPNEVKWVNNGVGATVVRLYVPLASLTNAQTYGVSVYVKDLVGTASLDWCDQPVTGSPSLTNTAGRLQGTSSRSTYDSTFRFLDITLTTGGMMTLYDPQVDSVNYVTPYVAPTTSRSSSQVLLDLTNLNTITATSLTYATNNTFSFNGTSNSLSITQPPISANFNNWTITGWIRPTSSTASYILTPQSAGIDHALGYDGVNKRLSVNITEIADVNNRAIYSPNNSVPVNAWTHFSASINNLNVRIYINGVEVVNQTESIPIANWGGGWTVGQRGNSTFWYAGQIPVLQAYNRALSAVEVAQNFNALRGRYGL